MARVAMWHDDMCVYLEENEVRVMGWRLGHHLTLETDLEFGDVILGLGNDATLIQGTEAELPYRFTRPRRGLELVATRFSPVDVTPILDEGALHMTIPVGDELPWPFYKECDGHDPEVELSRDFLTRCVFHNTLVRAPERVRQRLPNVVLNYARSGLAELALRLLEERGRGFFNGERRHGLPGAVNSPKLAAG